MAADWITEQQEQEYKDSIKKGLAMEAAQLVIDRRVESEEDIGEDEKDQIESDLRNEAVRDVIANYHAAQEDFKDIMLCETDDDLNPIDSYEHPSIQIKEKDRAEVEELHYELIDDIDI